MRRGRAGHAQVGDHGRWLRWGSRRDAGRGISTKGTTMTELDVELSRTVAALVQRRHLQWQTWTATGTGATAWALLAAAVVVALVR